MSGKKFAIIGCDFVGKDVRALPAREIARSGSKILACGSSEIIHCVDSEITAETAVVKKNGRPQGFGSLSLREGVGLP